MSGILISIALILLNTNFFVIIFALCFMTFQMEIYFASVVPFCNAIFNEQIKIYVKFYFLISN